MSAVQHIETDRYLRALCYLDPDMPREDWFKAACGFKDAGGSEEQFDKWSSSGASYDASSVRSMWKSIKPGKTTAATLITMAKQQGWKDDIKYERPSAAVIAEREAALAARNAQLEAEQAAKQEASAALAQALWDEAQPCAQHDYLTRKGVQSHGLRYGPFEIERTNPSTGEVTKARKQSLLIPLYDRQRNLLTLQAISSKPGGLKLLLADGKAEGCFFPFGQPKEVHGRKVFILGEGYATCASIYEAMGHMVLMCVNAGNILNVATSIRERDPTAIIVIAGDNDIWKRKADGTPHNPGRLAAEKAAKAVDGIVALPPFTEADTTGVDAKGDTTGPTDFNDLSALRGPGAVSAVIEAALATEFAPVVPAPVRDVLDVHHMDPIHPFMWPNLSERQKPLNTIPNLRFLLENYGFTARYDVFRKDMVITHPGQRGTSDNMRSKAIDTVISLCGLSGLSKADAPSFLMSIADDTPYNPVMEFITSKPWDGVSRLPDLLASVETKPGFDRGFFALLLRRWLISAVAAAAMPTGFWSKGVLVFQGDQSLGKTTWFRALLPQPLRDLMKVDASIDPSNKDTIISVVSHWLVELGELDGTLRKADIARLKGFISQDVDQFRRPYGRAEEKFQRRTVFFASVNPEHFLADDTGNVRWWTVPVTGLNSEHGIDMQQLWAEVYTLYQAGERWWLDRDEERLLNTSNVQYEQRDPIDELIASKYDFADPQRRSLTATQVLLELGYQSPSKKLLNDAGSAMRKHFGEWSKNNGRKVFRVPIVLPFH